MACPDCRAARETNGLWAQFNTPQCIFCTARLIQRLPKLRSPSSAAIAARRLAVLQDAVAWGWDESQIRALAKGPMALEPEGKRK
jgi:hypothetical protein